jgi:predicted flap endonuclease-1-like 5' DNA nuclease/prefoldin subunit 5
LPSPIILLQINTSSDWIFTALMGALGIVSLLLLWSNMQARKKLRHLEQEQQQLQQQLHRDTLLGSGFAQPAATTTSDIGLELLNLTEANRKQQRELQQLQSRNNELVLQLAQTTDLAARNKELESDIDILKLEIQVLREAASELDGVKDKLSGWERRNQSMETSVTQMGQELQELYEQKGALQAALNESNHNKNEIGKLQNLNRQLLDEMHTVQGVARTLEEENTAFSNLEIKYADIETNYRRLITELQTLQQQKQQLEKHQAEWQSLSERYTELEQQNNRLRNELEALRKGRQEISGLTNEQLLQQREAASAEAEQWRSRYELLLLDLEHLREKATRTQHQAATTSPATTVQHEPQPPATATHQPPDDFKLIDGISPRIEALLQEADITTFRKLSTATAEELHSFLSISGITCTIAQAQYWLQQASLAAAGLWTALKKLQGK